MPKGYETGKLRDLIKRIREVEKGKFKKQALESIGAEMLARTKMGFVRGQNPYGEPWAAISNREGQPLRDTGRLQASFGVTVSSGSVTLESAGTNVRYGIFHQLGFRTRLGRGKRRPKPGGKSNVVAREMVPTAERGLPVAWAKRFADLLRKILDEKISGHP